MLAALLSSLLATSNKPFVIAFIIVLICLLMLQTPRLVEGGRAEDTASDTSIDARLKPARRTCSISTVGTLIHFDISSGEPRVDAQEVAALATLASRYDIHLLTQLQEDSDAARAFWG